MLYTDDKSTSGIAFTFSNASMKRWLELKGADLEQASVVVIKVLEQR